MEFGRITADQKTNGLISWCAMLQACLKLEYVNFHLLTMLIHFQEHYFPYSFDEDFPNLYLLEDMNGDYRGRGFGRGRFQRWKRGRGGGSFSEKWRERGHRLDLSKTTGKHTSGRGGQ